MEQTANNIEHSMTDTIIEDEEVKQAEEEVNHEEEDVNHEEEEVKHEGEEVRQDDSKKMKK